MTQEMRVVTKSLRDSQSLLIPPNRPTPSRPLLGGHPRLPEPGPFIGPPGLAVPVTLFNSLAALVLKTRFA